MTPKISAFVPPLLLVEHHVPAQTKVAALTAVHIGITGIGWEVFVIT